MASVDPTNNSLFGNLDLGRVTEKKDRQTLGQDEFLELMVTQLRNQDPFKPLENEDFIAQMAQFSSVSGLSELKNSFNQLASSLQSNQALQASTLVGRSVLVKSNKGVLPENGHLTGVLELPYSSSEVKFNVVDAFGRNIREINFGPRSSGDIPFEWDGLDSKGEAVEPGLYNIIGRAKNGANEEVLVSFVSAPVESVTLNNNGKGLTLNLKELDSVSFSEVKEIR